MTDNKEIATTTPQNLSVQTEQPAPQGTSIMTIIERVAQNPEIPVDKIQEIIELQERIMDREAEIAFNEAMARLQKVLPKVKKLAKTHNSKYAKFEHIENQIRPLYTDEGFSISYSSKKEGNDITWYGKLSHVQGHSTTAELVLPADTSGGKNNIQAIGSTSSYARRYLLIMLFNIIVMDEDDDAMASEPDPIDQATIDEINDLIEETKTDKQKFMDAYSITDISQFNKKTVMAPLNALKSKKKLLAKQAPKVKCDTCKDTGVYTTADSKEPCPKCQGSK